MVYHFMWAFKRTSPKNQSIPVEIQNKGYFWSFLGLFHLFLRCSWLVLGLLRLFLACSWVVQVFLGLFQGVPSFSNGVSKVALCLENSALKQKYHFHTTDIQSTWNNNFINNCKMDSSRIVKEANTDSLIFNRLLQRPRCKGPVILVVGWKGR